MGESPRQGMLSKGIDIYDGCQLTPSAAARFRRVSADTVPLLRSTGQPGVDQWSVRSIRSL
jgi:hypothetical protein